MKAYIIDEVNMVKSEQILQEVLDSAEEIISMTQSESYDQDTGRTHLTITVVIKEHKQ